MGVLRTNIRVNVSIEVWGGKVTPKYILKGRSDV